MSSLTQWVDRLEARVERVEENRRALIPPERFNSASVLLNQLVDPFAALSHKHRFARVVTGSDAGVDLPAVTEQLRRLLRDEFQAFVAGHLLRQNTGLGDQVRALKSAIESQTKVLDGHVESFRKRIATEIESVNVQVKLFKALSIANHTSDYDKLQIHFNMLMRQYGQGASATVLENNHKAVQQALSTLRTAVTFDERLNLSQGALTFVRRILAGGSKAPSLLELTPALLAEIQQLREFAGTVRIARSE